jgi:RND family efflux transporter MFP subunit
LATLTLRHTEKQILAHILTGIKLNNMTVTAFNPSLRLSIACLLLACCMTACKPSNDSASNETKSNQTTQISVVKVNAKKLDLVEESVGSLESIIDPTIAAEISARVIKVLVHPGQNVKKGEVIALLDATDFSLQQLEAQSEVARIQALINNQQKIVERNRALVEKNFISKNALDDASTQLDTLREQLSGAKSRVNTISHTGSKNRVIAPTDGVIETQIVSNGDYVKIGDPIVKIVNKKLLRAHLPFPESMANKLKPGLTTMLTTPTSKKVVTTTIRDIKPQITATSRSIDVTADIQGEEDWQPGASVNAKVIIGSRTSALVVPEQSVVLRPAGEVVYIIEKSADGYQALQRIVKTGLAEAGGIEILEGLHGNEMVAVDGAAFLTDKTAVSISNQAR